MQNNGHSFYDGDGDDDNDDGDNGDDSQALTGSLLGRNR